MEKEGPQILSIGDGNIEASMIKILLEPEFNGTIGIFGHIKEEYVEQVLKRNLKRFQMILNVLYESDISNFKSKPVKVP